MPICRFGVLISLISIICCQVVLKSENITLPAPYAPFTDFNDSDYRLALQFLLQNHPELNKLTPVVEFQIVAGTYFRFTYANTSNSVVATVYVSLSRLVFFTSYRVAGPYYPLRDLTSYHWKVGQQLIISLHPQLKSVNVTVEFQDVYRGKNYRATYSFPLVQNIVVIVYVNNGYQSTLVSYVEIPISPPLPSSPQYHPHDCDQDDCHKAISTLQSYCPQTKGLKPIIQRKVIAGNPEKANSSINNTGVKNKTENNLQTTPDTNTTPNTTVIVNYRINYTESNISAVINVAPPNITSILYYMSSASPPPSEGYTTFTNQSDPSFVAALQKLESLNSQVKNSTMSVQCQPTLSGYNFMMSVLLPQSSIIAIVAVTINRSPIANQTTATEMETEKENNKTNTNNANTTTNNTTTNNITTNTNNTTTNNTNTKTTNTTRGPQMTSYLIAYDVKPRYELLSIKN